MRIGRIAEVVWVLLYWKTARMFKGELVSLRTFKDSGIHGHGIRLQFSDGKAYQITITEEPGVTDATTGNETNETD